MRKLRHKFLGVLWGLLAAAIIVFGLIGARFLSIQLAREDRVHDVALSRVFLMFASDALRAGRPQAVSDYMETLLAFPDLEEARLLEPDGRTAAVQGPDAGRPFKPDPASWARALASFTPVVTVEIMDGKSHNVIYQRVWAEQPEVATLGVFYMRFSTARIEKSVRRSIGLFAAMGLGLAGVLSVVGVLFAGRITRPLEELNAAVRDVGQGRLDRCVPVLSGDELGELAKSFNEMSRRLGKTTVSKDFFNDILDSIQDQVIVTDAAGLIVLVNPAVVTLLGWSRDELLGRPGAALLDGPEALFLTPSRNAAARLLTKSGETVAVLFSSSAIKADDGTVTGYIGAAKDVSDIKKLEARMQQSEKLSAVGQLAAGVAHEINNPLGVILGFAQGMVRQLKAGDSLKIPIKSIEREALRCKALVQNLLTFARTSHPDRAPMDVNAAVEQSLALIAPQAKIHQVTISTELMKGLPPVLGSKNQLEQVILNLAKNAIDAMPNGGSLTLSSELLQQAPHSWVCLKFVDDGTGIAPAVVSKIFDPFFTTKPIGQGTGLGLSLVSEIIQKHSGEISVESRPGRTEFTIKLPVRTGLELDQQSRGPFPMLE